MKEILAPTASCAGDRLAPLLAGRRPLAGDLQTPLAGADAHRGQREPAGVERGQRDLQAGALGADAVLGGDPHLVEAGHAVLQAAQAHEGVAVLDGDARRVRLDDEGGDPALVAGGGGHPRHHHEQVGDHAVGGPQLHAVQHVVVAVRHRGGRQAGGVGADVRLGQQERRDVRTGAARQEGVLLLLRAEGLQRLGDADRLVRGEQRADGRARRADQGEGPVVVDLGEAEAAVLGIDLHAERAELLELSDGLVRDPALALDAGAVDLRLAELAQRGEELLAAPYVVRGRGGVRMDEVEPEAPQEQFLGEAGLTPVLFTGRLGDLACFALGNVADGRSGHQELTSPRIGSLHRRAGRLPVRATCERSRFAGVAPLLARDVPARPGGNPPAVVCGGRPPARRGGLRRPAVGRGRGARLRRSAGETGPRRAPDVMSERAAEGAGAGGRAGRAWTAGGLGEGRRCPPVQAGRVLFC